MKLLVITIAWVLFASVGHADIGTPMRAVNETLRRAQEGVIVGVDLDALNKDPKHAWTKDSLLKLLAGIDLKKVAYEAKEKDGNIHWFPIDEKRSLVRLIAPIRMDFEVTFVEDRTIGCGGYLLITKVSP